MALELHSSIASNDNLDDIPAYDALGAPIEFLRDRFGGMDLPSASNVGCIASVVLSGGVHRMQLGQPVNGNGKTSQNWAIATVTYSGTALVINSTNAHLYRGCLLRTTHSGGSVSVTIDASAGDGFQMLVRQAGTSQVTVAGSGGLGVSNFDGHTKLAGQNALATLIVDGTDLVFAGRTAA